MFQRYKLKYINVSYLCITIFISKHCFTRSISNKRMLESTNTDWIIVHRLWGFILHMTIHFPIVSRLVAITFLAVCAISCWSRVVWTHMVCIHTYRLRSHTYPHPTPHPAPSPCTPRFPLSPQPYSNPSLAAHSPQLSINWALIVCCTSGHL